MIKDNLQNLAYYNYLNSDIKFGLKYIRDTDFESLENGRHELVEGKIFANIQEYTSKPEADCKYEAHKKYIDIQFIVKGEEKIGTGKIADFKELSPYDDQKDIVFLTPKENSSLNYITLKEKEFTILFPEDAHAPSIAIANPTYVKKVVVKVHL